MKKLHIKTESSYLFKRRIRYWCTMHIIPCSTTPGPVSPLLSSLHLRTDLSFALRIWDPWWYQHLFVEERIMVIIKGAQHLLKNPLLTAAEFCQWARSGLLGAAPQELSCTQTCSQTWLQPSCSCRLCHTPCVPPPDRSGCPVFPGITLAQLGHHSSIQLLLYLRVSWNHKSF